MRQTTLIPMLGTSQLDELVLYPQTTIEDVSATLTGDGASAHIALHHLSKARIEHNLDDVELNHSRDRDDDPYSVFSGEGLPGKMLCWYLIEGEDKDILRLQSTVTPTIPKEHLVDALIAANEYHGRCQVGRCYFAINEGNTEAKVFYESIINLSEGVTDSYLQRFLMQSLFAAHVFFEMMHHAKLFAPVRTHKRSKTTPKKEQSQPK